MSLHLIIAAILYDNQDKVINFSDYRDFGPPVVVGDQTLPFEICVNPPNQGVAHYEFRAWGE